MSESMLQLFVVISISPLVMYIIHAFVMVIVACYNYATYQDVGESRNYLKVLDIVYSPITWFFSRKIIKPIPKGVGVDIHSRSDVYFIPLLLCLLFFAVFTIIVLIGLVAMGVSYIASVSTIWASAVIGVPVVLASLVFGLRHGVFKRIRREEQVIEKMKGEDECDYDSA